MKLRAGLLGLMLLTSLGVFSQDIKYRSGTDQWNGDSLGNHRLVVQVGASSEVAKAEVNWRRRDHHTDAEIIVVDAKTNKRILNVKVGNINRESGEVFFQPLSGAGEYYIYFLPYSVKGRSNYPNAIYLKRTNTADPAWLGKVAGNAPAAQVLYIESLNEMNSFFPMEVIAKEAEASALIKSNIGKSFLVFPEDRLHPIKMTEDLPNRWIQKGVVGKFEDSASPGEHFTFQLGIFPVSKDLKNVKLRFSELKDNNQIIPAKLFSCLNTDGTGWDGKPVKIAVNVAKGKVQAMWCLADIPENTATGEYKGVVFVSADGIAETPVQLNISIKKEVLKDGGISEPAKQTRLTWLNSTLAQENTVISPYIPLKRENNSISLLGRRLTLSENGFPARIETFFTPEMTGMSKEPKQVIRAPVEFIIEGNAGQIEKLISSGLKFTSQKPGTIAWTSKSTSSNMSVDLEAHVEFDGFVAYQVKVTALKDVNLADIRLDLPMHKDAAKYMMGLNLKGGKRPASYDWKWDVASKNQDGAWLGDVNAGLNFSLRDEKYVRPLNTNFYLQKPLLLPASWGNGNKGGIRISEDGDEVLVKNYTHYILGFNNDFSYKGFELNVFFQGALDYSLYNMNRLLMETYSGKDALDRWTPTNTDTEIPSNGYFTSKYGGYINSRFVEDASYLRLKTLTLAYNLPLTKLGMRSLRIYVTGQDLLTFTNYTGTDPEVNTNGGDANLRAGLDFNAYPAFRSYTVGLKLNF